MKTLSFAYNSKQNSEYAVIIRLIVNSSIRLQSEMAIDVFVVYREKVVRVLTIASCA